MTVASSTSKAGPYATNGVVTEFPFPFLIYDESHLVVYKTDSEGNNETLVLDTHYTVSGVEEANGGTVTISPALESGYTITILRDVPAVQETSLSNQGPWLPKVHEKFFDLVVMMVQQCLEQLSRCVKVPIGSDDDPDEYMDTITTAESNAVSAAATASAARGEAIASASSASASATAASLSAAAAANAQAAAALVLTSLTTQLDALVEGRVLALRGAVKRVIEDGEAVVLQDTYSLVVADYMTIEEGGSLELEGDAALHIVNHV